jgi:hypothetical protein
MRAVDNAKQNEYMHHSKQFNNETIVKSIQFATLIAKTVHFLRP